MRSRRVPMLFSAALWLLASSDVSAATGGIRVESIKGAESVSLHRGYSVREAAPGDELFPGEQIHTGAGTTAVIAYPDGTKVSLLPQSNFQLEEPDHGVQFSQLNSGNVHGVVPKSQAPALAAPVGKKGMKFIIRTRTAVMGVRGTDFLVGIVAAGGAAQFHTLEGTVEVASHTTDLMGGKGLPISSGQAVQTDRSGKLGTVKPFTAPELKAAYPDLNLAAYPELQQQIEKAVPTTSPPPLPPPTELKSSEDRSRSGEDARGYLLAFALGGSVASDSPGSALGLYWTPTGPLPFFNPVYLRGSLGLLHILGNSGNSSLFSVKEYQLLIGTTWFKPFFLEAGGGIEDRDTSPSTASILTAQAGWVANPKGVFHRIFAGFSRTLGSAPITELRFGAGFQLF